MAKKYIIKAGGIDLDQAPVTQNESGVYYKNSVGTYYKPTLAVFDTVVPPKGYTRYTNGSHAHYTTNANRNPIDFSFLAGISLTMNVDVNVLSSNGDSDWIKVRPMGSDLAIAFVHTYEFRSGIVKAGSIICKIAPTSVTGYPTHLHIDEWSNRGLRIRKLILDGDFKMDTFKIGDRIEFTDIQNIRSGAGDKFSSSRQTVVGELATIKDGPRTSQNEQFGKGTNDGYTWWDMVFDSGGSGWVAMVDKFKVHIPQVIPPVDPTIELNKQIELLKIEIKSIKGALETSQTALKLAEDRVTFLEEDKKTWEEVTKKLEDDLDSAKEDSKNWQDQYVKIVTELNELKAGRDNWLNRLADMLHKLFSGIK